LRFPDFSGTFIVEDVINYNLRPSKNSSASINRAIGVSAVLDDCVPVYAKGREATIFFGNERQANLPHTVVVFEDSDDATVFLTVSDAMLDKIEMLMNSHGLNKAILHIGADAAPKTDANERDGVFDIRHFDFCWSGPGSTRRTR